MRVSIILAITIQPLIAVIGMAVMLLVDNNFVQTITVIATVIYSVVAMFMINTRWRVFLGRVLVLN